MPLRIYLTRGPVTREETTSSSAIIMSAPMLFWISIDFSGVRSIVVPSRGDWNVTPSYCESRANKMVLIIRDENKHGRGH